MHKDTAKITRPMSPTPILKDTPGLVLVGGNAFYSFPCGSLCSCMCDQPSGDGWILLRPCAVSRNPPRLPHETRKNNNDHGHANSSARLLSWRSGWRLTSFPGILSNQSIKAYGCQENTWSGSGMMSEETGGRNCYAAMIGRWREQEMYA